MFILFFFAFLSGLISIFAPCIWPLLPIVLASTAKGERKKPLGITLGILVSFGLFTLTISYVLRIIPIDPSYLRYISVFIIGFFGLTLLIPKLSATLEASLSRLSGRVKLSKSGSNDGFIQGLITGISLGIVWTPCAGPILATIAVLSATQSVNINVVIMTFFYLTGVGIPLFLLATLGKKLFSRTRLLSNYTGKLQQIFGIVIIITAILIFTNNDKVLEGRLLDMFPAYSQILTTFESQQNVKTQLDNLKKSVNDISTLPTGGLMKLPEGSINGLLNTYQKAPDFAGITKWLNTDKPLTITDLKGKVVLVDFWTYTCINCIRSLPHVTGWYDKYKDQGFTIIGVHTPEFEFEKESGNVLAAIKQFNIHYPVPQDNNYATWNNYNNQYWPAEYLIDAKGIIRRTHFGEGEYDQTEMAIQELLKEKGDQIQEPLAQISDTTPQTRLSPETYLGSKRMAYYFPSGSLDNTFKTFTLAGNPGRDSFSLGGQWTITDENAVTGKDAVLNYNFFADKVYLVLRPGTAGISASVKVSLDGKPITDVNSGADVKSGIVTIDEDRLYNLVDLKGHPGQHLIKLEFQNSGIEVFAFTFG
jgi:cytochrome c biogenesis protein CcdA/thiol-disulfide isomerase/thioredoxin